MTQMRNQELLLKPLSLAIRLASTGQQFTPHPICPVSILLSNGLLLSGSLQGLLSLFGALSDDTQTDILRTMRYGG